MTRKKILDQIHSMDPDDVKAHALVLLCDLLERSTMQLAHELTGITRATMYRWLDEELGYESMSIRDCAWFILLCETSPKLQMLLSRKPVQTRHRQRQLLGMETEAQREARGKADSKQGDNRGEA